MNQESQDWGQATEAAALVATRTKGSACVGTLPLTRSVESQPSGAGVAGVAGVPTTQAGTDTGSSRHTRDTNHVVAHGFVGRHLKIGELRMQVGGQENVLAAQIAVDDVVPTERRLRLRVRRIFGTTDRRWTVEITDDARACKACRQAAVWCAAAC